MQGRYRDHCGLGLQETPEAIVKFSGGLHPEPYAVAGFFAGLGFKVCTLNPERFLRLSGLTLPQVVQVHTQQFS